jgi:hypothetical protein
MAFHREAEREHQDDDAPDNRAAHHLTQKHMTETGHNESRHSSGDRARYRDWPRRGYLF